MARRAGRRPRRAGSRGRARRRHGRRTGRRAAAEVEVPAAVRADPSRVDVELVDDGGRRDGHRGRPATGSGCSPTSPAMLALQRVSVRAARAWPRTTLGGLGVGGRRRPTSTRRPAAAARRHRRGPPRPGRPAAAAARRRARRRSVAVRPEASRAGHRARGPRRRPARRGLPGLRRAGPARTSRCARRTSTTLGPQAVDVFYVQEPGAGALSDERAASAAHAVRAALLDPVTLDADRG